MARKKINPNRVVCSGADIKRAAHEGIDLGCNRAIRMVLYILLDKHGAPPEDVRQLADEVAWLAARISEGRISWGFVDQVLHENGVEVRLR